MTTQSSDGDGAAAGGPRVQFVSSTPADNVNFSLMDPSRYCQDNPLVVIPCYINGDPLGGGPAGDLDVLVGFNYNAEGKTPAPMHLAIGSEMGARLGASLSEVGKNALRFCRCQASYWLWVVGDWRHLSA